MRLVHGDHICSVCESTCDSVTDLRRQVKELQDAALLISFALVEARELRDFAHAEIDRRFTEKAA